MNSDLFALAILMSGPLAAGPDISPDAAEMDALRTGRPVIEYTQTDASGGAARVSLMMYAPPEPIWDVLVSCERSFEYVDGLRDCEVVEGGLEHQVVRQGVKKHWLLPRMDYLIEFDRVPFTSIDFRRIEGDLRRLEGRWRFQYLPREQGTLVTHEIRIQPSFPVPRWLVRRSLASDLPEMLLCLRARSGGSRDARQEAEDLGKCPPPREIDRH